MRWTFDDVGRWWLGGQGKRSAVCVKHDEHEDEDVYAYKREREGEEEMQGLDNFTRLAQSQSSPKAQA
jgi:hypothetical protein